jgi:hypothetical protein
MEGLEVLQGFFSLVIVAVFGTVGSAIILKSRGGRRPMPKVGVVWIGMCTPWLHGAISFLLVASGLDPIPGPARFLIALALIPAIVVVWLDVLTRVLYFPARKWVVGIFAAVGAVFDAMLFFAALFYPSDPIWGAGEFVGLFQAKWSLFTRIGIIFFLAVAFTTGIFFGYKTLKVGTNSEMTRGLFLLTAFPLYAAGAVLDSVLVLGPVEVVITRAILLSSAVAFYLAFLPPDFVVGWVGSIFRVRE